MRRMALACVAMLTACGGEEPLECSRADRDGTYLAEADEMSGNCGPMPTSLVQVRQGDQTTASGCEIDYERWSDADCTLERSITCIFEADGLIMTSVGITEQMDSIGDIVEGTMTVTFRDLDSGAAICSSTYTLTYTRQ